MKYLKYKPLSVRRTERRSKNRLVISLLLAAFFIYALFAWILPTVIGGLSIFKKSPIPNKQRSQADSPIIAPPVLNIPFESTNTAQISIQGYASPNSQVEIYLEDELKTTIKTNQGGDFTTSPIDLAIGVNNITAKTVDANGNKSLNSKTISVIYDNNKPKLTIDQPIDNQTISSNKLTVAGSTDDDSGNTLVTINGVRAVIGQGGAFSQIVTLNSGDNTITAIATNQAGNSTQVSRHVTYQSDTPTPSPSPTANPSPTSNQ